MQVKRRTAALDPSANEAGPKDEAPIERLLRTGRYCLRDECAMETSTRPGRAWRVNPKVGNGVLWHFPITDEMAVACCRIALAHRVESAFLAPEHYCVGLYRHLPLNDDGSTVAAREVVLGHAWKGQAFIATPSPGETLESTCIVLTARALQVMSLRCQCDPYVLSNAIAMLDGSKEVPGLHAVFEDIASARPSPIVARAFYESKATEAMSLIVDWSLSSKATRALPMKAADRTALNRARRYIAENLDRTVPTEELCEIACMSASKLAALFKSVEHATPQEYARTLRMERARALLAQTDLPLSAVSQLVGFQRQGSFSEAFKARYGVTPRDYRALARKRF